MGPNIYLDLKKRAILLEITNKIGTELVHDVDRNKSKYSLRLYSKAVQMHELKDIIGTPKTQDYIKYIEGNMIPNYHIIGEDFI